MAFKNSKNLSQSNKNGIVKTEQTDPGNASGNLASRSFSVNTRVFGKDITNKVLNSTGAVAIPNQTETQSMKTRQSMYSNHGQLNRKPSPSVNSNN